MLGIDKLVHGREEYYLSTVPTGRHHDGGLVEADGVWLGSGAASLGLTGTVQPQALRAVLAGVGPGTGEVLSRSHARGRVRVAGYDCTFSPPKSLSVLHALGPDEAVGAVRHAHATAVAAALSDLEHAGARSRRPGTGGGRDGRVSLPTEGLVAASFLHRTSRAPDPHLHSHVLVVNCAPGGDGRWSPLDGRALYLEAGSAADLYEVEVRREVVRTLGLRFGRMRGASADLEGIDPEILLAFSRRSSEIKARLAERGWHGRRASRMAALVTRKAKDLTTSYEELQAGWRERAVDHGLPVGRLDRLVEAGRTATGDACRADSGLQLDTAGLTAGLTATRASFTRSELVRAACRSAPGGAVVAEVEDAVDGLLGTEAVVERGTARRWLRRPGMSPVPAPATEMRYTTPEVVAIEAAIDSAVHAGRSAGLAVAGETAIEWALAGRRLPAAVEDTAVRLLRSGHAIDVVWAERPAPPAGAGVPVVHTDALDAARAGWEAEGRRVLGVAPTAPGARRLEALTAAESVPLDALGRTPAGQMLAVAALPAGSVLAVGAVERLGPRRLAALLEGAEMARVKVVLVAGSALAGPDDRLVSGIAATTLAWGGERAPDVAWRAPSVGVATFPPAWFEFDRARVAVAPSAGAARQVLVDTWREYAARERPAVVVVDDVATRHALHTAGCGPVVTPRGLPAALGAAPGAALLVLGSAAVLPAAVRRDEGTERVHVATERVGDAAARLGRAGEIALPIRLVRAIGAVPRTAEGRTAWREAADAWCSRDLGRQPGCALAPRRAVADERLADAMADLNGLRPERGRRREAGQGLRR